MPAVLIVAVAVAPELQVPPGVPSLSETVLPVHTLVTPLIDDG